jgi:hypothetical protein
VCAAIVLAAWTAHAEIEVFGSRATLRWTPAAGSVSGYNVIVSRNGGTPRLESVVSTNQVTLGGVAGETLTVLVAAFGYPGGPGTPMAHGPLSPASDRLRFASRFDPSGLGVLECASCKRIEFRALRGGNTLLSLPHPSGGSWELQGFANFLGTPVTQALLRERSTGALWIGDVTSGALVPRASHQGSNFPTSLVGEVADLDGDGATEVVLRNMASGNVQIWGLVNGTFTRHAQFATPVAWWLIGAYDLDNDGQRDLWFDTRDGGVEVVLMEGFEDVDDVAFDVTLPGMVASEVADYDGDELPDLLWLDASGRMTVTMLRGSMASPSVQHAQMPFTAGDSLWRLRSSMDLDGVPGAEIVLQHSGSGAVDVLLPKEGRRQRLMEPTVAWRMVQATR